MSTNISGENREALLSKIAEIKTFIEKNTEDKNASQLLSYLGDLSREVNGKKYGLVFEEHREKIDELLDENAPVFTEEKKLFVDNGGELNFLLEGDNLASLKLLEKTHRGKIDVIYIDPPYNTGNSFIYDDKIIDENDNFKHSKYASFIYERLKIAKNLLTSKGIVFISIDDQELSVMRLVCDEIFGEDRFLTTIGWEKRTKCQNTDTARKMLQPKIEYVLVYKNFNSRAEFNCHVIGKKDYPELDEKGCYRIEEVGQMGSSGIRGRGTMIFPILGIFPRDGNQWKIGQETVNEYIERKDIFKENGKVFRKIRPSDESSEQLKPFWALFGAEQFGTAESAKSELNKILGTKEHEFETVKTVQMIEELIFQSSKENSTILDFFAGSGTTGQAVLECNRDYGGHRKFILCTNNENGICRDITYQRLKTAITGKRKDKSKYSDGLPGSLKYFKTDFIPISEKMYYEYADELLLHVRELVELENAVNFDKDTSVAIVLDDDEMEVFIKRIVGSSPTMTVDSPIKTLYLGHDVLLSSKQERILKAHNISVNVIPDYYYRDLAL
ncbi:MAG: site-specific DNA-methyltransferase [Treponema sp.]|nr:site-specific DNA-methyltransferase [Treponema sp.]